MVHHKIYLYMNITLKIGNINLLLNNSLDVLGRNGNSDVRLSSLLHNIFVLVSFQGNRLWLRAEKKKPSKFNTYKSDDFTFETLHMFKY